MRGSIFKVDKPWLGCRTTMADVLAVWCLPGALEHHEPAQSLDYSRDTCKTASKPFGSGLNLVMDAATVVF